MPVWNCTVLQDGAEAEAAPNEYRGISASYEWQAQLIAFIMDGGLGDTPDGQPLSSCVELAKAYTEAVSENSECWILFGDDPHDWDLKKFEFGSDAEASGFFRGLDAVNAEYEKFESDAAANKHILDVAVRRQRQSTRYGKRGEDS